MTAKEILSQTIFTEEGFTNYELEQIIEVMESYAKQKSEPLLTALKIIGEGDPVGIGLDEVKDVALKGIELYEEDSNS